MTTWEYTVVKLDPGMQEHEARLDQLGNSGWELVAVVEREDRSSTTGLTNTGTYAYLKRPKPRG